MKGALLALLCTALPAYRLAAQCPDGTPPPCGDARGPAPNTVAVLPFENLSRDTGDAYLARDLTEEITTRLIKVERLSVTSPTVMRRYRGSDNPRTVAQTLRVAYLVSGTVRRDRDRLRISVELLRARDGVSPWTDVFDQRDTALLDIQIQIAQSVASAITGRLLPQEQQRIAVRPTRDPVAYDLYARGRFALSQRTTRSLLRAAQYFEGAARRDATFGAALAGQSQAYRLLSILYYDGPMVGMQRDSLFTRAAVLAAQALLADSNSADVWANAAMYGDPAVRRARIERALALSPRNPEILYALAVVQMDAGDTAGARISSEQVVAADPTNSVALLSLGIRQVLFGNYAQGARLLDSAVSFRPDAHFFYFDRAYARLHTGDTTTMRADAIAIRRLDHPAVADALLLLLDVFRRDADAMRTGSAALARTAAAISCEGNFDCIQLAMALAAAGDHENALTVLERARITTTAMSEWLRLPEFDGLRSNARFLRIVASGRPMRGR